MYNIIYILYIYILYPCICTLYYIYCIVDASHADIQYSSARDLKKALREVAPMNASKSQIFCPNGTSSAVSPLMENKCNDIEAMPSVFGRSDDLMGNSIPGRNLGGTTSLTADTGGFPSYGSKR